MSLETKTFMLPENTTTAHKIMSECVWQFVKAASMAGHKLEVTVRPAKRSTEQNRRLWAMLADISCQVDWYGRKLTPEEWKHVFTAALSKQDVVPEIDGGFVVLGKSTSQMSKSEMSDLQQLMEAFGVDKGVKFSAKDTYEGH